MDLMSMVTSWQFYAVLLGLVLVAWGAIKPIVKKIPVVGNKQALTMIAIGGLVLTSGILGSDILGTASMGGSSGSSVVSDLQITTNFATDAGGSVAADTNEDDIVNLRATDVQANESSGTYEIDDGIITVTRVGDLSPMSCPVVASTSSYTGQTAGTMSDGVDYLIVEETTLGELEVYLADGGAATTSSPKQSTYLAFADGDATSTLGVLIEVEEGGHDALTQYNYKDVVVNICGKPMTFRIWRMD